MRISNLNKQMFVMESMIHQATAMWATSTAELTYFPSQEMLKVIQHTLQSARAVEVLSIILTSGINTLRTSDADLRFYITTVQDG